MNRSITEEELLRMRMRSQRLSRPEQAGEATVRAVCGLQAQDFPAGLLAACARSSQATTQSLRQAFQSGDLIRTWCMRGTLHLVTRADAAWLVPLFAPVFIRGDRKRAEGLGWDEGKAQAGMRLIQAAVGEQGPLTRAEIVQVLKAGELPYEGQAPIHLLYRAAFERVLIQGPYQGKQPTFSLYADWIGKQPAPLTRETALAELARRYLAAYAPASPRDMAAWCGLGIGEVRKGWDQIQKDLLELECASQPVWILKEQQEELEDARSEGSTAWVRLLPIFDIYLLGYAKRDLAVDPAYTRRYHPGGGWIYPVLLNSNGRAIATWSTKTRPARAGGTDLAVDLFEAPPPDLQPALEREIARFEGCLGQKVRLSQIKPPDQGSSPVQSIG